MLFVDHQPLPYPVEELRPAQPQDQLTRRLIAQTGNESISAGWVVDPFQHFLKALTDAKLMCMVAYHLYR